MKKLLWGLGLIFCMSLPARSEEVGLINLVGNQAILENLGATVFGNYTLQVDVSDWGMKAYTQENFKEALRSKFGYGVRMLEFALDSEKKSGSKGFRHKEYQKEIREIAARTGLDNIVVLSESRASNGFMDTRGGDVFGYGIYYSDSLRGMASYSVIEARIFDSRKGRFGKRRLGTACDFLDLPDRHLSEEEALRIRTEFQQEISASDRKVQKERLKKEMQRALNPPNHVAKTFEQISPKHRAEAGRSVKRAMKKAIDDVVAQMSGKRRKLFGPGSAILFGSLLNSAEKRCK